MSAAYFYRDSSGKEIGPLDLDALVKLRAVGVLNDNTSARSTSSAEWKLLREFLPPLPATPQIPQSSGKSANWTWAGLLIAVIIILIASHASNPSVQHAFEAEQSFRKQIESEPQSKGIKVVSFKTTSGQSFLQTNSFDASVVENYKLNFEAEIESEKDRVVNGVAIHQGDLARFAGSIFGSKKESGWIFERYRFLNFIGDSSMREADESGARNVAQANECINHLRQLDAAANQFALEKGKRTGDPISMSDLTPYIKLDSNGNIPPCPAGGVYNISRVGENPTCSLGNTVTPNHALQ